MSANLKTSGTSSKGIEARSLSTQSVLKIDIKELIYTGQMVKG